MLVFHAYINEMHGSRSKIHSKKSRLYIHDVTFLALLGAPYIYDISRLRVKIHFLAAKNLPFPSSRNFIFPNISTNFSFSAVTAVKIHFLAAENLPFPSSRNFIFPNISTNFSFSAVTAVKIHFLAAKCLPFPSSRNFIFPNISTNFSFSAVTAVKRNFHYE
jgi:hypothetical protein